jgi:hypothetical protein
MGSWNETCAISNLPILAGDDIKLLLLKRSPYINDMGEYNGVSNATEQFIPILSPINGKYDDYGGIEDIVEDDAYWLLNNYLIKNHSKLVSRDGERITDFNLEMVIDSIVKQELKHMVHIDKNKYPYNYILIHSKIWDGLVDGLKDEVHAHIHMGGERNYVGVTADVIYDNLIEDSLKMHKIYQTANTPWPIVPYYSLHKLIYGLGSEWVWAFDELLLSNPVPLKKMVTEFMNVGRFMNYTRRIWSLTGGKGSQGAHIKYYQILNKLSEGLLMDMEAKFEEWDDAGGWDGE